MGQERGGRGGTQPRSLPVPGTQARGLVAVGEVTEALWGIFVGAATGSVLRPSLPTSDPSVLPRSLEGRSCLLFFPEETSEQLKSRQKRAPCFA